MSRSEFFGAFIGGSVIGLLIGVAIIAAVFATGSTFGQRCATAYPNDRAKQLWCVEALSSGKLP